MLTVIPFGIIMSPGLWSAAHGPSHFAVIVTVWVPPATPSPWVVTVIVYALSKLPVTTACEVVVLPAVVHVLTNQNGAILTLSGRQMGLIVAADLNGLVISLR